MAMFAYASLDCNATNEVTLVWICFICELDKVYVYSVRTNEREKIMGIGMPVCQSQYQYISERLGE